MSGTSTALDFRVLDEILAKYEYKKSYLIAMLQKVQEVYRYLPEEAMTYIGEKVDEAVEQKKFELWLENLGKE